MAKPQRSKSKAEKTSAGRAGAAQKQAPGRRVAGTRSAPTPAELDARDQRMRTARRPSGPPRRPNAASRGVTTPDVPPVDPT